MTDAGAGRAGAWNRDEVILFTPNSQSGPLHRVSSSGGASTPVTTLLKGETVHRSISFLPDGHHFLFFVQGGKQALYVGSLESMERKLLRESDVVAAYAPPGFVLFLRERTLMAQRLDLQNLELSGAAFPIVESVGAYLLYYPTFSVSNDGVLVYSS